MPTRTATVPIAVVDGRYNLYYSLGSGALGEVFYAEDTSVTPPRPIAFKRVHAELLNDPTAADEIRKEYQISQLLQHENILNIERIEVRPDIIYSVTKLAQGSLADKTLPLPPEEVAEYLRQIAAALDFAHSKGQVHRDLKLENILIGQDGRVLVADFSLAMQVGRGRAHKTFRAEAVGTPLYASPEQWEDQISKCSDIYALGVLVYYMLTGKPPFQGTNDELRLHHKLSPVPLLHQKNSRLDHYPELSGVLATAMAKKTADRFPSANEFYEVFSEAVTLTSSTVRVINNTNLKRPLSTRQRVDKLKWSIFWYIVAGIVVIALLVNLNLGSSRKSSSGFPTITLTGSSVKIVPTPIWTIAPPAVVTVAAGGNDEPLFAPRATFYENGSVILSGATGTMQNLAWASDGKVYAATNAGTLTEWKLDFANKKLSAKSPQTKLTSAPRVTELSDMQLSPDGTLLLLTLKSGDKLSYQVYTPGLNTFGKVTREYSANSGALWHPTDASFGVYSGNSLQFYAKGAGDYASEEKSVNLPKSVSECIFVSQSGRLVCSEGNILRLFETSTQQSLPTQNPILNTMRQLTAAPDGNQIAFIADNLALNIWNLRTSSSVQKINLTSYNYKLAWSPDSTSVALGGEDGKVMLFNLADGNFRPLGSHQFAVKELAFSPDGKYLASVGNSENIHIWKVG